MHPHGQFFGPVGLVAEPSSQLADRIAGDLAARSLGIVRIGPGERAPDGVLAAVVLIEHKPAMDVLSATLEQLAAPALVLAATPEMVVSIPPLLGVRHDLGIASDATDVLVWRLTRLIELPRLLTAAQTQLDPLTGLFNRRAFQARLHDVAGTTPPDDTIGLLYIDLDGFKAINDALGHGAGDCMLQAIGERLSRVCTQDDLLARLGGDEFAVLLTRRDADSLVQEAERILKEVASLEVSWGSAETSVMRVNASAGLTFVRPGATSETLMNEADVATYEAKNAGRNRVVVYGRPADTAKRSIAELRLRHFEGATRLASERLAEMIALKSRRLIDAAKQEACICHLTGLYNRGHFDPALSRDIDRARSQGCPLSLALIDIDQFGRINKTHGWPTGDLVLQTFAVVARANVRPTDWIARYAGDEFVIVMPDTTLDNARQVLERVRQAFASASIEGLVGQRVEATMSGGVAQLEDSMHSAIAFVDAASQALLRAKGGGRDRTE